MNDDIVQRLRDSTRPTDPGLRMILDAATEIERLRDHLAAAAAVIAKHDQARGSASPPPCCCVEHIAWREVLAR